MSLPLTLPPVANLAIYLLIVAGMVAVAVALDRWLAVAELRPGVRRQDRPTAAERFETRGPKALAVPSTAPLTAPARHQWAASIPALLSCLGMRERAAFWTIIGGALALRILLPERFPDFLTSAELARMGAALRIEAGIGAAGSPLGFDALLAVAWTLFGTTLPLERFLTALCVVVGLIPFYVLLRRAVGILPALGALLLLGVSRPSLLAGRGGEADVAVLLLAPLGAWLLLRARERGGGRTWALCGVVVAALLLNGATGWGTLLALAIWFALLHRRDVMPATQATRQIVTGLLFAGGFAVAIFLLTTLIGGAGLRAAIPFSLDSGPRVGPLDVLGTHLRLLVGALFAGLTGGALDPSAADWRDPVSTLLAVAGAILALRRGRQAALWWCLAVIPTLVAGIFGDGDPNATIRVLLLLPAYAFVAFALDAILGWERLREPAAQLVAVGVAAVLVLVNTIGFALWSAAPDTFAAQGPTIATRDFSLWHDYQASILATGRGIVGPEEYSTLAPAAIVEQIAAARREAVGGPPQATAAPRGDIGKEIATIGVGENGGHLDTPHAVAIDGQGEYHVADTTRGVIVHFRANGDYRGEWTTEQTGQPWAIVAVANDALLVLDADSGKIGRYDTQGQFIGLVLTPSGAIATRGLGVGRDGKVYVAQTAANHVVRIDPAAGWAATPLGGSKQPTVFNQPTAALADVSGNVVVYEPDGARLRSISTTGQLRFNRTAPGSDTINAGSFTILPDGRIALVDAIARRVVVYSATGGEVGSFPVNGMPRGIAITPLGLLAVTDLQEKVIRLYTLTTP